jgi:hypothetical protein
MNDTFWIGVLKNNFESNKNMHGTTCAFKTKELLLNDIYISNEKESDFHIFEMNVYK